MRGVALILALLPGAALAQSTVVQKLGTTWVGADGNQREAKVGLQFGRPVGADPAFVRRLEINWRDFPYQQGPFLVAVGEDDQSATIGVELNVDAGGVPRDCRTTTPSGLAPFDNSACPHLMRYLRFYPALTPEGTRVGGTLAIRARYFAGRVRMMTGSGAPLPMSARPKPKPLAPIDAAAIGFGPRDGLPASVGGTSGSLRVEADGAVSACTLAAPTQIDRFDMAICERLRAWKFEPAQGRDGRSIASDYSFGASRPR